MTARAKTAGFTLIEALVALTLLALLSTGIVTMFRLGQRTYTQVIEQRRSDSDVVRTQRFLRQALESAYPFALGPGQARFGLEGRAESIEFTALSPHAIAIGHYRYAVFLRARDDRFFDLVVRSAVDRHGFQGQRAGASEELLIERIAAARWSYVGAVRDASGRLPLVWQTSWTERKVPALVRLEVDFPADDRRSWPEFLVATRITDDAQCEFDVVAQACREGT